MIHLCFANYLKYDERMKTREHSQIAGETQVVLH